MTTRKDCKFNFNGTCKNTDLLLFNTTCDTDPNLVCERFHPNPDAGAAGRKFDQGKTRWELLPWSEVENTVRVLMRGSEKYSDFNWQKVPGAKDRYFAAAIRHLLAYRRGEKMDPETGLPHLSHLECCVLFLAWFDNQENKKETK